MSGGLASKAGHPAFASTPDGGDTAEPQIESDDPSAFALVSSRRFLGSSDSKDTKHSGPAKSTQQRQYQQAAAAAPTIKLEPLDTARAYLYPKTHQPSAAGVAAAATAPATHVFNYAEEKLRSAALYFGSVLSGADTVFSVEGLPSLAAYKLKEDASNFDAVYTHYVHVKIRVAIEEAFQVITFSPGLKQHTRAELILGTDFKSSSPEKGINLIFWNAVLAQLTLNQLLTSHNTSKKGLEYQLGLVKGMFKNLSTACGQHYS